MKTKYFIIILMTLMSVTAIAQKKSKVQTFAVAATKMNVVYSGIDNPVKVAASGYSADAVTVSVNGASIKKTATINEYIIYNIQTDAKMVEISLTAKGKLIGKEIFKVKQVPMPLVSLGVFPGGSYVTIDELISTVVEAESEVLFDFEGVQCKVLSFVLTYQVTDSMPVQIKINGSKIADNRDAAAAMRMNVDNISDITFSKFEIITPNGIVENNILLKFFLKK